MKKYIPLVIMGLALAGCRNDDLENSVVDDTTVPSTSVAIEYDGYYNVIFSISEGTCAKPSDLGINIADAKVFNATDHQAHNYSATGLVVEGTGEGAGTGYIVAEAQEGDRRINFDGHIVLQSGGDGDWSDGTCSGFFHAPFVIGNQGEPSLHPDFAPETEAAPEVVPTT